jgi:rfaE bifunctional protein kinase chain/domain
MPRNHAAHTAEHLSAAIGAFSGRRVVTIADLVLDEFVDGRVERVSREAPVLILEHRGSDFRLGGGANAVANIRALGGTPLPLGVVGRDAEGRMLQRLLREHKIDGRTVFVAPDYRTPVKTRILAGGAHAVKQQIVRLDRLDRLARDGRSAAAIQKALESRIRQADALLVSDYGLGLVQARLVRAAIALARQRRIPITVDTRHNLLQFRGMTAVTPNEGEVEEALGITIGSDRRRLETAGRTLLERLQVRAVLITRGGDGMALFEPGRPVAHIPIYGTDQVADVTGAGDTVIATFTLALAAGVAPLAAAHLANYAGGIVVMKRGTATVAPDELRRAILADARAVGRTAAR